MPGKKWLEAKYKTKRKRRSWRKLHLGLDLASGEIICADLTTDGVGDSTALPGLLAQIDGPVAVFLADGAYDGDLTCDLLVERFGAEIDVTIPPPKNAVLSPDSARNPTVRDQPYHRD
ncbi:transposase [Roseobacter fucihabitans]|uniref:transposase n=1 Tax=Roseobacter fucihabitans TaxID=1537242 RepID=UPI0030CD4B48